MFNDPDEVQVDAAALQKALPLKGKGKVYAIEVPDSVCKALKVSKPCQLSRAEWKKWLPKLKDASHVLLWVRQRREDDQKFLKALGNYLPKGVTLWSFHAMGLMIVDRLTGDAVQTLLESYGLRSGACSNTGFGWYARSFDRDPEVPPKPLAKANFDAPKKKVVATTPASGNAARKKAASSGSTKKATAKKAASKKKSATKKKVTKKATTKKAAKKNLSKKKVTEKKTSKKKSAARKKSPARKKSSASKKKTSKKKR